MTTKSYQFEINNWLHLKLNKPHLEHNLNYINNNGNFVVPITLVEKLMTISVKPLKDWPVFHDKRWQLFSSQQINWSLMIMPGMFPFDHIRQVGLQLWSTDKIYNSADAHKRYPIARPFCGSSIWLIFCSYTGLPNKCACSEHMPCKCRFWFHTNL